MVVTVNEPYATPKPFGLSIKVVSTVTPVAEPSNVTVNALAPAAKPVALKYTLAPSAVGCSPVVFERTTVGAAIVKLAIAVLYPVSTKLTVYVPGW